MPIYVYKCANCESIMEINHGMNECVYDCPKCRAHGVLNKQPTGVNVKVEQRTPQGAKPGETVKVTIDEVKEQLQHDKEALKHREWKK